MLSPEAASSCHVPSKYEVTAGIWLSSINIRCLSLNARRCAADIVALVIRVIAEFSAHVARVNPTCALRQRKRASYILYHRARVARPARRQMKDFGELNNDVDPDQAHACRNSDLINDIPAAEATAWRHIILIRCLG